MSSVCLWTVLIQLKAQNTHVDSGDGGLSDVGSTPTVSTKINKGTILNKNSSRIYFGRPEKRQRLFPISWGSSQITHRLTAVL